MNSQGAGPAPAPRPRALEGSVAPLDYPQRGIRVNPLAPGPILTDNLRRAGPLDQRAVASATPIRRIGQPDEVAAAAVWLCPDPGRPRPGSTLVIDGGKLAARPPFAPIAEAG
jgi:NAD(P)-dependent dehydrogenase (short-subunit alcohol dehydrogenase family)